MSLQTFDPKALIITAGGETIKGFAETQIAISRPDPMWNSQVGAHGDTMRVKTNNRTTNVTITLQQSSPSLAFFNLVANADESTDSNGVFGMEIKYVGGVEPQVLLSTADAYIEQKPDATWGNTPQDREFTIMCANADYDLGATSQNDHNFPIQP